MTTSSREIPENSSRDWPEDFEHENGNYMCRCHRCLIAFFGHKRRVTCKQCASSEPVGEDEPKLQIASNMPAPLWCIRTSRYCCYPECACPGPEPVGENDAAANLADALSFQIEELASQVDRLTAALAESNRLRARDAAERDIATNNSVNLGLRLGIAQARIATLERELEEMRTALKPFANVNLPDWHDDLSQFVAGELKARDFRRLRSVLTKDRSDG